MSRLWFALTHVHLVLLFALHFVRLLVVANASVVRAVYTPGLNMRPGIVVIPTSCTTDLQLMLLANTITLTPGTLSLQADTETRELYVHGLFIESRERFVEEILDIERILLRGLT